MSFPTTSLRDQEYCRLSNEQLERERMIESWRVAALTDEERRDEQFERDGHRLNTYTGHGFSEERVKEIHAYATAKWRRLNPEKAAVSDAGWAAIRASGEAEKEKELLRVETESAFRVRVVEAAAARRAASENQMHRHPQVYDAPAKKKATIVNGVLTWS